MEVVSNTQQLWIPTVNGLQLQLKNYLNEAMKKN